MAGRSMFVGRSEEQALLRHWLDDALGGTGRLILISGPAGMGKTRLTEEITAAAGVPVGWGAALDDSAMPPLWMWMRALRAFDGPRAALAAALEVGGAGDRSAVDAGAAEFAAHTVTIDAIEDHARTAGGMVLVLEDLHWADASSLRLLDRLASVVRQLPLLVVGTQRRSSSPELSAALPALLARSGTEILHLQGMPYAQADQLVMQVVPDCNSEAVAAVTAQVGGNPLYLRTIAHVAPELLRHPGPSAQALARVPELRDLIAHALAGLGTSAPIVQALSVLGSETDLRLLAELTAESDLGHSLRPAVASGLVEVDEDHVRLVHALVREAVYTSLHPQQRLDLHRRAAATLERRSVDDPGTLAGEIARHWGQTDSPSAALPWAVLAAETAGRAGAHDQAAEHLRRTLEYLDSSVADGVEVDRVAVLFDLARHTYLAGDLTASLQACQRAADEAIERDDAVAAARAALVITGVEDPALKKSLTALAACALRLLESSATNDLTLLARLEAQLAASSEHGDEASGWASRALEHAIESGDPDAEVDALAAQWPLLHEPGQGERRLDVGSRMLVLATTVNRPLAELWGHAWRIDGFMERCDVASARAETSDIEAMAERLRLPIVRWHALRRRAAWALLTGEFAAAEQFSQTTVPLSFQLNDLSGLGIHTAFVVASANFRGVEPVLPDELNAVVERAPALPVVQAQKVLALWCCGRQDEAALAFRALPLHDLDPRVPTSLGMIMYATEMALHLGDAERCELLAGVFRSMRAATPVIGTGSVLWYGSTARSLGRLTLALGSTDDAIPLLEEGVAVDESIGARPFVGYGHYALATALKTRGDKADIARAIELARLARDEARRLDMPGLDRDASRLLAEISTDTTTPGALTAREREIAELVIQAKSNRAIAEQLFLSERTVEGHVRNILAKTGSASRTELIRHFLSS